MGCSGNPAMATAAGVAIGLVCIFAVVGTLAFVTKAARWWAGRRGA